MTHDENAKALRDAGPDALAGVHHLRSFPTGPNLSEWYHVLASESSPLLEGRIRGELFYSPYVTVSRS